MFTYTAQLNVYIHCMTVYIHGAAECSHALYYCLHTVWRCQDGCSIVLPVSLFERSTANTSRLPPEYISASSTSNLAWYEYISIAHPQYRAPAALAHAAVRCQTFRTDRSPAQKQHLAQAFIESASGGGCKQQQPVAPWHPLPRTSHIWNGNLAWTGTRMLC